VHARARGLRPGRRTYVLRVRPRQGLERDPAALPAVVEDGAACAPLHTVIGAALRAAETVEYEAAKRRKKQCTGVGVATGEQVRWPSQGAAPRDVPASPYPTLTQGPARRSCRC